MKIAILNGSPKGDISATMQHILYIKKKFPQHEYKFLNVAQQIKILEKNEERFNSVIEELRSSDGVIWGFPLYIMLVPAQYKRFIELIYERNVKNIFKDKYSALFCTSIHFYDTTAINYVAGICEDLEMKFVGDFSADMYELLEEDQRRNIISFAEEFFSAIENNLPTSKRFQPLEYRQFEYTPSELQMEKIDLDGKIIRIFTDSTDENTNLGKMIKQFQNCFSGSVEVVNINDVDIIGGCIGCAHCAYDNICVYRDKDGFTDFYFNKLQTPDILIYAGNIKDRYLSARWKMVLDRSFFRGHTPTVIGKQFGYLLSGPLSQIPNMRQIIRARVEISSCNLVDVITDEFGDSKEIDLLIYNMAKKLIKSFNNNYIKPGTFLAVGGQKIFRDLIYGRLGFVFQADRRYYEEHGLFDFPQDDEQAKKMNDMFGPLLENNEKFRKEFYGRAMEQAIKPLQDIIKNPKK